MRILCRFGLKTGSRKIVDEGKVSLVMKVWLDVFVGREKIREKYLRRDLEGSSGV